MPLYTLIMWYFLTAVVFFGIDMLWLGFLAKDLYKKLIGHFLSDQVNWTAAILFYLLFIVGIMIFAIMPALEKNSLNSALLLWGLFGLFTYATYDLTNLATIKGRPLQIVFIDIAWGMCLTALVSGAWFIIFKRLQ